MTSQDKINGLKKKIETLSISSGKSPVEAIFMDTAKKLLNHTVNMVDDKEKILTEAQNISQEIP